MSSSRREAAALSGVPNRREMERNARLSRVTQNTKNFLKKGSSKETRSSFARALVAGLPVCYSRAPRRTRRALRRRSLHLSRRSPLPSMRETRVRRSHAPSSDTKSHPEGGGESAGRVKSGKMPRGSVVVVLSGVAGEAPNAPSSLSVVAF